MVHNDSSARSNEGMAGSESSLSPGVLAQCLGDMGGRKEGALEQTLNKVQEANAQVLSPTAKLAMSPEQADTTIKNAGLPPSSEIAPLATLKSDTNYVFAEADQRFNAMAAGDKQEAA